MFRKSVMLASAVVTAVALAAPGAATADWTAGTEKIEVGVNVPWTGAFKWQGEIGSISCTAVHSEWTLEAGTTGKVNAFEPTASSCVALGALAFFGCTVTSVTATGLPWTTHIKEAAVEIVGPIVDYTLHGGFCPYHELRVQGSVQATPDDPHAMTEVAQSGAINAYNNTSGAFIQAVGVSGDLVTPPTGPFGIT